MKRTFQGIVLNSVIGAAVALSAAGCRFTGDAVTFNREAAAPESRAEELISALEIRPGQAVADIGAGGGYFTLRFAALTGPLGRVYAVDVNREFLDYVRRGAASAGLGNVTTVLAAPDSAGLAPASVDLIFVRNVFHHLRDQEAYFRRLAPALGKNGRVAVIEYKKTGGLSHVALFGHYTPESEILAAMEKAGYRRVRGFDFLPGQSFNIFARAGKVD